MHDLAVQSGVAGVTFAGAEIIAECQLPIVGAFEGDARTNADDFPSGFATFTID